MEKYFYRCINRFQEYKTKKFSKAGHFFLKLKINANLMTLFSLIMGLLAVYFLFSNYLLFVVLAILHLLADGLDGVIARIDLNTLLGKYFDRGSDTLVTILVLIKVAWFTNSYYAYLTAGLFTLVIVVHLISKFKAPIVFMRTAALIVLIILTFPLLRSTYLLLTIGYSVAGLFSLYSLTRQLQWYVEK